MFPRRTLLSTAISLALLNVHAGQITTDGSVGAAQTLSGSNYTIPQTLGTTAGNNLFHSFGTFNLDQNDKATFTGTSTLQNVISRVTDGHPSTIDGTIKSEIGQANFFFLNPAGVVFGKNASVDVPAAFHVSTAQELRFIDGSIYSATLPRNSSLTIAAPVAFGFLGKSGDIRIENGQLKFNEGSTVTLAGGSVVSEGGNVTVPRGRLRVYGQGDMADVVTLDGDLPKGNGTVTVNSGSWDVSGDGGGDLRVSGGAINFMDGTKISNFNNGDKNATGGTRVDANTMLLDNSGILGVAFENGDAGSMRFIVNNAMTLTNGSSIWSNTSGTGDAGSINITAGMLTVDGGNGGVIGGSNISSDSQMLSKGMGGDINIQVVHDIAIINSGWISSSTWGSGVAGNITIGAENLKVEGKGNFSITGEMTTGFIMSKVSSDAMYSSGHAGNITINASNEMRLINNGFVSTDTYAEGNAGTVSVTAGTLVIDGGHAISDRTSLSSAWISSDTSSHTMGRAGEVIINVNGEIRLVNNGMISSATYGPGIAGNIKVTAGGLAIDGGKITVNASTGSTGNAGNIEINVKDEMHMSNGGSVASDTYAQGDSGTVNVTAGHLIISGQTDMTTSISSNAHSGSVGKAKTVTVTIADDLQILNGGVIASATFASGNGGDIVVTANHLIIDGQAATNFTGITAQANSDTTSTVEAGSVEISIHDNMNILNGGEISSANYGTGNAGQVIISGGVIITLADGVIATAAQTGNGGTITIHAPVTVLNNSRITTSVAGETGDGGNITVSGNYLVMNTGFIQANTAAKSAKGGTILIDQKAIFPYGGLVKVGGQTRENFINNSGQNVIQAAAPDGVSGNIKLTSPDVSSNGTLLGVAGRNLDISRVDATPCAKLKRRGSLKKKGRGGLPATAMDSALRAGAHAVGNPSTALGCMKGARVTKNER